MKITDKLWTDVWSKEKYEPISTFYISTGFGADEEPEGSILLSTFMEAMGDNFREGMTILDYGCGSARLCNFMSKRLKDFTYYGVEQPGGTGHSTRAIEYAKMCFGHDERVSLGMIGDEVEKEGLEKADTVLLLSIFTHLKIEDANAIMDKFMPLISRGGTVIFSAFLKDRYKIVGKDMGYGLPGCYFAVYYTQEQLDEMEKRLDIKITQVGRFDTSSGYNQLIFKAEKK